MRPLIGITSNLSADPADGLAETRLTLKAAYPEIIAECGGAPVILPLSRGGIAEDVARRLDGLILSGGGDIPPEFFGANPHPECHYMPVRRWESECLWLETARRLRLPVLGVCLGMQVMNVASGGSLIQDIATQRPEAQPHQGPGIGCQHTVHIVQGSRLAAMAPPAPVNVTSSHHQAVDAIGKGYRVTATAPDGIIEAIEALGGDLLLGVQWHPERCLDQPNWLLRGFVTHCAQRAAKTRPERAPGGD